MKTSVLRAAEQQAHRQALLQSSWLTQDLQRGSEERSIVASRPASLFLRKSSKVNFWVDDQMALKGLLGLVPQLI